MAIAGCKLLSENHELYTQYIHTYITEFFEFYIHTYLVFDMVISCLNVWRSQALSISGAHVWHSVRGSFRVPQ